ncbi:MAG: DUF1552 domain-containing protein [Myxococcota bacterium]
MKMHRRTVLKGLGGLSLSLPFLEGLRSAKEATAGEALVQPFAIFMRQANGVASAQSTDVGDEPERFWPSSEGLLSPQSVAGRTLEELDGYLNDVLAVGVDAAPFDYGDGHARGVLQGLTAMGPTVIGSGGEADAAGESIDNRIGRELNPDGRESLFLYAGLNAGWMGGACQSYRAAGDRRAPLHNPVNAYALVTGIDGESLSDMLVERRQSVNDLVREQMAALMANPRLSANDLDRLELHRSAIRDLEGTLSCMLTADEEAALDGAAAGYESTDGDQVLAAVRAHIDVAVLSVACGYTRSVSIQIGNGNDGTTRYRNLDTGEAMENYHYISHRRESHGADGAIIPDSDLLHSMVDRQFAQTFRYLMERLANYPLPQGRLLDAGVAVWHNDQSQGPSHSSLNLPYILGGSANEYFRTGQYVRADGVGTHCQLLNMIGTAAGLRNASGGDLDDFGDPSLPKDPLPQLLA